MPVTDLQMRIQLNKDVNLTVSGAPDPAVEDTVEFWWEVFASADRAQLDTYWLVRKHTLMFVQNQLRIMMDTTSGSDSVKASQLFAQVTNMLAFAEGQVRLLEESLSASERDAVMSSTQLKPLSGVANSALPSYLPGKPGSVIL